MKRAYWRMISVLLWVLALILAVWTLQQLPLHEFAAQLASLHTSDWIRWSLLNMLILYLAVKRWQIIGHAVSARLSLLRLFRLRQAGSAVSFLTPGPHFGGEPLQLFWLHKRYGLPLHTAGAMLGLDRAMETAINLLVLLLALLVLMSTALLPQGDWLQIMALLTGALLAMLLLVLMLLRHPLWLAQRLRPFTDVLRNTVDGQRTRLAVALLLSMAGWVALFAELVLMLAMLGLAPAVLPVVMIMVAMRLAMLLPVPGGIGTIEASIVWSFTVLQLPISAAAGLIALIRLRDAIILLTGLGCLGSFRLPRRQTTGT